MRPSPESVAATILKAWLGGPYIPVVIWCGGGLRPRPRRRVVPERPDRALAVREEHHLAVVALLRLLHTHPASSITSRSWGTSGFAESAGNAARSSPAATCGSSSARAWRSSGSSRLEVLLNWYKIPALNFNILAGNNAAAAVAGTRPVRLPRVLAVGPHRRRGDRRGTPHHPAADPLHRRGRRHRGRRVHGLAVAAPDGRRGNRVSAAAPAAPWSLPEFWGKIPHRRAAVAVLGADASSSPRPAAFNWGCSTA